MHFTLTRRMTAERYVVAELNVRSGQKVISKSSFPAFVRENSATYYIAVAPEYVADSTLELADRTFGHNGSEPVPLPGGTDFLISLKDFAPSPNR